MSAVVFILRKDRCKVILEVWVRDRLLDLEDTQTSSFPIENSSFLRHNSPFPIQIDHFEIQNHLRIDPVDHAATLPDI